MQAAQIPLLTDGLVRLRAHRADDAAGLIAFANDPRAMRWVPLPHPYGPQQAGEFLQRTRAHWADDPAHPVWAIEVDGRFAGGINLHPRGPGSYEVGFSATPEVRGRGIVGRAAALVCDYAFAELGAKTVTWRAARGNFASWRVAWSAGFALDGWVPAMHHDTLGEHLDGLWFGHVHAEEPRSPRHPWWEPAGLSGERVVLRAWRDDDQIEAGPASDVRMTAQDLPTAATFADWLLDRREDIAAGRAVHWCIADRETDGALGHLQIGQLNEEFIRGSGAVAYWLLPAARGRGLIQEALDLAIPHAFAPRTDLAGITGLGLRRLQAGIDSRNRASRRTLLRAGFRFWGSEREVLGYDSDHGHDAESFELLASDDRDGQRVTPLEVPELCTERLLLRAWGPADTPRPDQVTDPDARRFMSNELPTAATFPASLRRREQASDRGNQLSWCITDRATGDVLGNVALFSIGDGTAGNAELGYWLWQSARGRGIAAEAAAAVVEHAKGAMGLTRLHAETDLANIASQRILRRLGFEQWGTDHAAYTNADGSVTDGAHFELLDRE
ncbi:GNAT family N-acetyltransferase [Calidifontibacter terrae]